MSRRLLAAALVLTPLAVPFLAACGEDEQENFAREFRTLDKQVATLTSDVGKTVNAASGKSDKEIEGEFGTLSQRSGELAQKVDELEPPDDLQRATDDLGESLGDAQDALREIQKAAADSDPAAARKATIQLVTSSKDLTDARSALERATR